MTMDLPVTRRVDLSAVKPGTPVKIDIEASDYDKRPVKRQKLTILVGRNYWTRREFEFRKLEERTVTTNASGRASVKVSLKRPGDVRIVVIARDRHGNRITGSSWIWCYSGAYEEVEGVRYPDLKIITDKKSYTPGETAKVLINAAKPGAMALVTVEGERLTVGSEGLDSCGMDLMALLTGSEGLLGVVTDVTVKLLPRPQVARVVLGAFDDVERAGEAVSGVIGAGIIPAGLEMMDHLAIVAAEDYVQAGYPLEAQALLLCELDGSEAEVEESTRRVADLLRAHGATAVRVSQSDAERELLWKGRKSAFPAIGRLSPDYYCMDGTIPRHQLAVVLREMQRMSEQFGLRVANVFHAGDGNLHPLILFDESVPGELERAEAFGAAILELCVRVGGCITGEHGVGMEKIRQVPLQFSEAELTQLGLIKLAFDGGELLNPGKGIPILRRCQEYRSLDLRAASRVAIS